MSIFNKYKANKQAYAGKSLTPELWDFLNKIESSPTTIQNIANEYSVSYSAAESQMEYLVKEKLCSVIDNKVEFEQWENKKNSLTVPKSSPTHQQQPTETKSAKPSTVEKKFAKPTSTKQEKRPQEKLFLEKQHPTSNKSKKRKKVTLEIS